MTNNFNSNRIIPSLLVRDMQVTLNFYKKLGFTVTGCDGDESAASWAEVSRESIVLQFYIEAPVGTPDQPVFSGTLYIHTSGIKELAEQLGGMVEFVWGPEVMDYGMYEFAVLDPNGYYIAFAEPADSHDRDQNGKY